MQKYKNKQQQKATIMEISIVDGFVMTIEKKRNRTVPVQLESLNFFLKIREWSLKNIEQYVCNRHPMLTHGGVEKVVLKFSYIIRHGSDIITE